MDNQPHWLRPAVEDGLAHLFSLNLDATPSDFEKTVRDWCQVLTTQTSVQLVPADLNFAFNALAQKVSLFPTVQSLIAEFPPQQWFKDAISSGLQHLLVLALDFAPAAENIKLTRDVWAKVLWKSGELWDSQEDTFRIAAAFEALCLKSEKWPKPKSLLSELPKRRAKPALPERAFSFKEIQANRNRWNEMMAGLGKGRNTMLGKGGAS